MNTRIALIAVNEYGKRIGQSHHNARILDSVVLSIRIAREERKLSYNKLAVMFNLGKSTIQKICNYERRAQIPRGYKRVVQVLAEETRPTKEGNHPGKS